LVKIWYDGLEWERTLALLLWEVAMKGIDLKIARIKAGKKQYEVAAEVGICPTKLSRIELGKDPVSSDLAERILAAIEESGRGGSVNSEC
jgi:DNA-binding XRE family transcriptional regulator